MGRITHDLELRKTGGDVSVLSFRIAVDRRFIAKDGERQTDFISCVAWRQTAENIAKYFSKGQRIIVEGSIQCRSYEDKEGNKRTAVEVNVDSFHFVEKRSDIPNTPEPSSNDTNRSTSNSYKPPAVSAEVIDDDDDDLPF